MVCRGTTVLVVVLALLTQTVRSAEPTTSAKQQRRTAPQRERVKITVAGNSLKYVIRDPAIRRLVGSKRPVRQVNHEFFKGAPEQQRILVSQLDDDRARDALDALREITDDLDLDLPKAVPDSAPERPVTRPPQVITPPVEPPIESFMDEANADGPAPRLDALQDEQRKQELRLLLESVNRDERSDVTQITEPDQNQTSEVDTEAGIDENAITFRYDDQPVKPEPIYDPRSNYDEIPWTIKGLSDTPDDFDRQCREQEFCEQIWQCAGGRCMSPCDRWRRDARRNYETAHGACPCSKPMSLLTGWIVQPMLGYGFFAAPMGGGFGDGCGCTGCTASYGVGCQVLPDQP